METNRSKKILRMTAATAALLAIIACGGGGSSDDPSSSSSSEATGGATAIEALGLEITMPGSASVSELLGTQMVSGGGVALSVWPARETDETTLEGERSASEIFSPTNVQEVTLEDGWQMTFQNQGGAGTNYFVRTRREIGGTAYFCDAMLGSEEAQQQAVQACLSLRAAG